ncbi:MAG: squalene/phytoene synthase family protein [Balneolaceae bacterium]|nr:squalene/phytoene synthase family protein [Balneolaceae bacterium]
MNARCDPMTDLFRISYKLVKPLYRRTSLHRSVIEEVRGQELQEAYAQCREITRTHAKTFYMATRFLPNDKQRGIFALYALCRYVDDLVDEAEDLVSRRQLDREGIRRSMEEWKRRLEAACLGGACDHPILRAFSHTLNTFHIPLELPLQLIEGVGMDLYKRRYETFGELYGYAYKVASVVGLMTCEIFGYRTPEALDHAEELGIAMQLTNILRDVGEDLRRDRIYLPAEELRRFGVTEKQLLWGRMDGNFRELMRFQIDRARRYYARSDLGVPMLEPGTRLPVYLARYNYSRILDKIEENGYRVFDRRAYLNATEKLAVLPGVLYRMRYQQS